MVRDGYCFIVWFKGLIISFEMLHRKLLIVSIYKVVKVVCVFVCPIITRIPQDQFASNFDYETREPQEYSGLEILSWLGGSNFTGKNS